MRTFFARAVVPVACAGLLGTLTLSCTDPSPTFVFDAAIDVPRTVVDARPDVGATGGASGSGGAGGSSPDGGTP